MPARRTTRGSKKEQTEYVVDPTKPAGSTETTKGTTVASKLRKRILEATPEKERESGKRSKSGSKPNGVRHVEAESCNDYTETVMCNFSARKRPPDICSSHILTFLHHSPNFVHYLYGSSLGKTSFQNKKSLRSPVVRELEDLSLFRRASPFDRRTTAFEWHPTKPNFLAAGSKGGDIILWDTMNQNFNDRFIQGIGPGGSVQAIKFWPWNTDLVLTASIDGQVTIKDFEGRHSRVLSDTYNCYEGPGGNISGIRFHPFNDEAMYTSSLDGRLTIHDLTGQCNQILLDTLTWDFWYCCVDVNAAKKVVATGDNVGNTLLLSLDGKKLWSHRLHKQKVTHAEFSPRERWLLCTASTDQTVKMWDIRKMSGRDSALFVLKHDKPINSAYFSHTDGCRLLTTDQHSQLRVYCGPEWILENTISHPHRFFQHLTPIKASWHPLQDLIVVGRYPDKDFPGFCEGELRTIDFIDAVSGEIVSQLHDPQAPGIVSLNKFNARGDYLASGMGVNILLWGRSEKVEERQQQLLNSAKQSGLFDQLMGSGRSGSGRNRSGGNQTGRYPSSKQTKTRKSDAEQMKMKLQTKTKTKTKNPR